jgi:hypothetical protein
VPEQGGFPKQAAPGRAVVAVAESPVGREPVLAVRADREHRATINRSALAAFVEAGISEDVAKQVVTLIAAASIPNVTINY